MGRTIYVEADRCSLVAHQCENGPDCRGWRLDYYDPTGEGDPEKYEARIDRPKGCTFFKNAVQALEHMNFCTSCKATLADNVVHVLLEGGATGFKITRPLAEKFESSTLYTRWYSKQCHEQAADFSRNNKEPPTYTAVYIEED